MQKRVLTILSDNQPVRFHLHVSDPMDSLDMWDFLCDPVDASLLPAQDTHAVLLVLTTRLENPAAAEHGSSLVGRRGNKVFILRDFFKMTRPFICFPLVEY